MQNYAGRPAETYTAPTTHAEFSHLPVREMFKRWADELEREAQDMPTDHGRA